jgi:hypothetical protein
MVLTWYQLVKLATVTGNNYQDRPRSGQLRVSKERQDRLMIIECLKDGRLTVLGLRRFWEEAGVSACKSNLQ